MTRTAPAPVRPLMTIAQAADYLACSDSTVRRRVEQGKLRFVKLGKLLRFRVEEIQEYAVEQTPSPDPESALNEEDQKIVERYTAANRSWDNLMAVNVAGITHEKRVRLDTRVALAEVERDVATKAYRNLIARKQSEALSREKGN